MGSSPSKLEKSLGTSFPDTTRLFGLDNFGNTCYCNSVLQALFFCDPFREQLLARHKKASPEERKEDSLLDCLCELFALISSQKKQTGSVGPRRFVRTLRDGSELFRGLTQQDAHEFLNYLLNEIASQLQKEAAPPNAPLSEVLKLKTFVHDLFEGTLTNKVKCLACENVSYRDESFLDLSVDVGAHSSLTACLRRFSHVEMMGGNDKFFCEACCTLQEAQKRMLVKKLPVVLTIHLKRFKYMERVQRHCKLSHRVPFPFDLRIPNTVEDSDEGERLYSLFAVVIHIGSGPNHGHYVSVVKHHAHWLLFDDHNVDLISEEAVANHCFGSPGKSQAGYILFYAHQPPSAPRPARLRKPSHSASKESNSSSYSAQSSENGGYKKSKVAEAVGGDKGGDDGEADSSSSQSRSRAGGKQREGRSRRLASYMPRARSRQGTPAV